MSGSSILLIIGVIVKIWMEYNKYTEKEKTKKRKYIKNKNPKEEIILEKTKILNKSQSINNFDFKKNDNKKRFIVDREKEIFSSEIITKENLLQDIIFAEIINKPKSKRK